MKHLYEKAYFTLVMFCAVMVVSAQNVVRRTVPRPLVHGVNFVIPQRNPVNVIGERNRSYEQQGRLGCRTVVAGKAPQLRLTPMYTPYDTLLLTKYTYTGNGNLRERVEVGYDEFGLRKYYIEYNKNGEIKHQYKYDYTIGGFNFWTVRDIKEYESGVWRFYSKEERSVDSQKRLVYRKTYRSAGDGDSTEGDIDTEEWYDYAHDSEGRIVKRICYQGNNQVYFAEEYKWVDMVDGYICIYWEDSWRKSVAVVETDEIETTIYENRSGSLNPTDDDWVKVAVEHAYHGDMQGFFYESFDGGISYGNRSVTEHDVPSSGMKTTIEYEYDADASAWTPRRKEVATDSESGLVYGMDYKWDSYIYIDDDWEFTDSYSAEWQRDGIYKITSGSYSYYEKYDADMNYIGYVQYDDEGGYILTCRDTEVGGMTTVDYVYYYDADGKQTDVIKIEEVYVPMEGFNQNIEYMRYFRMEEGRWVPLTELTYQKQGFTFREVYEFGTDGMPLSVIVYASRPDYFGGEEFVAEKSVYTYETNGYRLEEYESDVVNGQPVLCYSEVSEYWLLDDGTFQTTHYMYDEGKIVYASRNEENNGIYKSYAYDTSSSSFVFSYGYCSELVITDESTGYTTYIARDVDGDGNVFFTHKAERYEQADGYYGGAEYDWDDEANKWVGIYKYLNGQKSTGYRCLWPSNPLDMYDDEYLYLDEPIYNILYGYVTFEEDAHYVWNSETDSWMSEGSVRLGEYSVEDGKLVVIRREIDNETVRTVPPLMRGMIPTV